MHFFHALGLGVTGCAEERREHRLWGRKLWIWLLQEGDEMFPGTELLPGSQVATWKRPWGEGRFGCWLSLTTLFNPSCKRCFLFCRAESDHFCPPDMGLELRLTH